MTTTVTAWLVSGGCATLVSGIILAITSRGKNRADAAKINSETAIILLAEMRKNNEAIQSEMVAMRRALLAMVDAVETQANALESGADPRLVATRLRTDVRTARAVI